MLLGCSLPQILGLLHLPHVSAAVLVVGGTVAGAVGGSMGDAIASAILVVFAILLAFIFGVRSSGAVLTLLNVLLRQPLTLHVCLDPEVGEKNEEEGSIHPDQVEDHGELVVAAVHEVILGCMERHEHKLGLLGRNHESAKCSLYLSTYIILILSWCLVRRSVVINN